LKKHKKHIIIVGTGSKHENAPKRDKSSTYEIWGLNDIPTIMDVDLTFEMHDLTKRWHPEYFDMTSDEASEHAYGLMYKHILDNSGTAKGYKYREVANMFNIEYGLAQTVKRVSQLGVPMYCVKQYEFENSDSKPIPIDILAYPFDKIIKRFHNYFTNSVDYMLAYAAYNKVDKLDLYGIDMALPHERIYEKPGVEFWLGILLGQGVKIAIHCDEDYSKILKTRDGRPYPELEQNEDGSWFHGKEWF